METKLLTKNFKRGIFLLMLISVFITNIFAQESVVFSITGWDKWINPEKSGTLKVKENTKKKSITLNGKFNSAAGWVIEREMNFGGKTLELTITGSESCEFDKDKMFKLEVNNAPLIPIEQNRRNLNDGDYVNSGDGKVTFKLPAKISKVNFIFWNAELRNLTISGKIK